MPGSGGFQVGVHPGFLKHPSCVTGGQALCWRGPGCGHGAGGVNWQSTAAAERTPGKGRPGEIDGSGGAEGGREGGGEGAGGAW